MTRAGRLASPVAPEIAAILFEERSAPAGDATRLELELISEVDRAHLAMLGEAGLAPPAAVAALLGEIARLREERFDAVVAAPRPRGLFLAYEGELIARLGMELGGVLHAGRSRNDLNATTQRMRARTACHDVATAALALVETLLARAREHAETVMPAYTHYQVAMPITVGHYLLAIAWAALRNVRALLHALTEIDLSPLGAGAGAGTTLPIDTRLTARLLGFEDTLPNTLEAVASRDYVLSLLASAAQIGVLLGRAATDLLLWSTDEVGFVGFPDDLVGSSSMMPQKRNPFVLEHVQGRSCAAAGAFVAAVGAMSGAPFANSVAVGTEGTRDVVATLRDTGETITLLRLAIAGMRLHPERMHARAVDGYSNAAAVAEALVASGTPFRQAHGEVGALVREAFEAGRAPLDAVDAMSPEMLAAVRANASPASVVARSTPPGGPAPAAVGQSLSDARDAADACVAALRARSERWRSARAELDAVCAALQRDDA